jgi:hypothetical protein
VSDLPLVVFRRIACEKCAASKDARPHCASPEWGVFGPGLVEGETIAVRKSDGSVQEVEVGTVLWRGRKNALARVGEQPPRELLP